MTYYFDVDGVLADFHSAYNPAKRFESLTYNFIRNLAPFAHNVALVKELIASGNEVFISTMVANEVTKQARIDWLREMIPELAAENIITIVGNGKKHEYMKTSDGILIDDKKTNCRQWEKAGFKAIWLEVKGAQITL